LAVIESYGKKLPETFPSTAKLFEEPGKILEAHRLIEISCGVERFKKLEVGSVEIA
jgi:hypothetical protein